MSEENWASHKIICKTIYALENDCKNKVSKCKRNKRVSFWFKFQIKEKSNQIVGDKGTLNCEVEDKSVNLLWDSGAQVSILTSTWLNEHLQGKEVFREKK